MTTQAWDAYWANPGTTNSFAFDYTETDGPYGALNAFWLGIFAEFKDTDNVVDLAAGNGALATLFAQSRETLNCASWLNIDSAAAHPKNLHNKIRFAQQNIEHLDLNDASVDMFVSMYGFEYSDIAQTYREITRCLKPEGKFAIFMHHPDAVITKQSEVTVAAFSQFLADPFWQNIEQNQTLSYQILKQTLLQNLNQHLQSVSPKGQDDIKLIGQNIFYLLQSNHDVGFCVKQLRKMTQNISLQVERLKQQIVAANRAASLPQCIAGIKQIQWDLTTLDYQGSTLGYCFTGSKQ